MYKIVKNGQWIQNCWVLHETDITKTLYLCEYQ